MNKVSIVIPLYKSERYMRKLCDSIRNQSYTNFEVILVDDGSPDNSGLIAEEYVDLDNRFVCIHKENGGTCEARNTGLDIATGKYLMFADGDDWLENDCLEYLVKLMEDNCADMSMTDAIFTTRDRTQSEKENVRIWDNTEAVANIINTFLIPVGPWNKLYSLENIRENNISFSVPWFGEGLYFSTMAAMTCERIAVGHRKVYNYRLNNPNSGCTVREINNGINALNNIYYIRDHLTVHSHSIDEALAWHIWTNIYVLLWYILESNGQKEYGEKLRECKTALKYYLPHVMQHSKLENKEKLKIIVKTMFPKTMIKRAAKKVDEAFKNDNFE